MSWAYDPLIAMFWWIAVIGALIFFALLTYYLYFVRPIFQMYQKIRDQVQGLHGEISIKIISDQYKIWLPPVETWTYVARHPLDVKNEPHL